MERRILSVLLIAVFLLSFVHVSAQTMQQQKPEEPRYIVRPTGFGFSILVGQGRAGPLKVIYISGNAYDRGYEYGYLAAEEIRGVLNWAYNVLGKAYGVPGKVLREKFISMAKKYEPYIPEEYIDEMKGIADGFNAYVAEHPNVSLGYNITYLDIMVINTFVDFSCTGAVISGNLTVDGNVLIGTTIDAPPLAPYFVYVVERPDKGHQIAYFTAAGSLFQNGFNDVGLGMIEHHIHDWKGVIGMPEMIRDRYVLQYSDNVKQAIMTFIRLLDEYNFSGYGDDVSISDRYGNIAKLEVTPYRIGFIINPQKEPTWPKQDPFLRTSAFGMPIPTPYVVYYKVGYTNVLRGKGWIVNGLYTLNETVVGLPGFPSSWQEAINSSKYSWIWEAPERYEIAHYIYDKILRGEKLSIKDGIIMSQLPLVGDAPYDDGAIWMEPQIGLAVILKGQSSFAKPVFLQTFYPIKMPRRPSGASSVLPMLSKIYNNTISIVQIANELKPMIEALETHAVVISGEVNVINSSISELNSKIDAFLSNVSKTIDEISNNINNELEAVKSSCNAVLAGQNNIMNKLDTLSSSLSIMSKNISSSCEETSSNLGKLYGAEVATLILVIIVLGVVAYLLVRREG